MKKKLHLISNAHIDPVWQWEKEEGIGAVITTFASAVNILEENEGFIFNHNEAVLYMWIENYAPALFERIKKLIEKKQWVITGGWYIQPDCNMPSGESIARQIIKGKNYFKDKFNVDTNVAVNYDSFGHSKGLVQIMQDAGYIGYICTRPHENLECRDSIWEGFNGSSVMLHQATDGYNSLLGSVDRKIPFYLEQLKKVDSELMLWGVGNHGGGPSRQDLKYLDKLISENKEIEIKHSTNEIYFAELDKSKLEVKKTPLNYFMQGCYTSQIRIKQKHLKLENELLLTEKILAHAELNGMEYDISKLKSAEEDLLFSEFHDILPGSSIKEAEESALIMLDRALENLKELKIKAFFYLCNGQELASDGEYPILVYNPHPYEIQQTIMVEMMLSDQNWSLEEYNVPKIYYEGNLIKSQLEKESSNLPLDWRKRIVFDAVLKPFTMHRFNCFMEKEKISQNINLLRYVFNYGDLRFEIDSETGLAKSYKVCGVEYIKENAFQINIIKGSVDPWGFHFNTYKEILGAFKLATVDEANLICNLNTLTSPINIIEDGDIRTVVQVFFVYNQSYAILNYTISKINTEVKVDIRMVNLEKDKVIKLSIPTNIENGNYCGKTCYGVNDFPIDNTEVVSTEWSMFKNNEKALSIIHFGNYGSSVKDGVLGITLLNTACYTTHPIDDRKMIKEDRYTDRIDIGERNFEFVLNASETKDREQKIEIENLPHMQKYIALNYSPLKYGQKPCEFFTLDNKMIMLSAIKKAERTNELVLRLFNTQKSKEKATLVCAKLEINQQIELNGYEFKTFKVAYKTLVETNILEIEK